jgi:hypothetical protein
VSLWIFLINTLLLYIPHLTLTDGQIDRQRSNTLVMRGLEKHYFQLCCCVSFLVVAEIVLGDTYLPYQLCRCVFVVVAAGNRFWLHRLVFWLWGGKVLGVTSLPTIPVVLLCQFLVAVGNSFRLLSF